MALKNKGETRHYNQLANKRPHDHPRGQQGPRIEPQSPSELIPKSIQKRFEIQRKISLVFIDF
eukprot:1828594-Karenia_brevis.AAC.1